MLRYMNLPSQRVSYARLYVNDIYFGVYHVLEPIDKEFIKSR